ncbi:MAG: PCMD domain-containing protein [Porphyromonadaceae bacterium]|nr:PCMD domain-containing protein [Porphyromonadaceae bacterium]
MRKFYRLLFLLIGGLIAWGGTSCIQDEKPNVECDIEDITVEDETLITYIKIERDHATVSLKQIPQNFEEDINPSYTVSRNATYEILSSTTNGGVHVESVKVTSEDRQYSKTYTVLYTPTELPDSFGFEYWDTEGTYEKSYEHGMTITNEEGEPEFYKDIDIYWWDSGNLGFSAVASGKTAKEYPTFSTDEAHGGSRAAKLVTRAAGSLGTNLGKPIASGNIFLGEFSSKGINLLQEALKATHFGYPYDKIPTSLDVYFKYKRGTYDYTGAVFETRDGTPDICGIYAVFFDNVIAKEENSLDISVIDGTNVFTSASIIAIANLHTCDNEEYRQLENGTDGAWKFVNIPFKSVQEGVDYRTLIDPERLKNKEYSLTIVCCSSYYGDYFEGAVDSELTVDDITIHYEEASTL